MELFSSQSDLSFVRYAQNTEAGSWMWRWCLWKLVKFIDNSSELLWAWSFVTNTFWMSSFICRWFHINPIPGLRDIVKLPKVARNRAEQRKLMELPCSSKDLLLEQAFFLLEQGRILSENGLEMDLARAWLCCARARHCACLKKSWNYTNAPKQTSILPEA